MGSYPTWALRSTYAASRNARVQSAQCLRAVPPAMRSATFGLPGYPTDTTRRLLLADALEVDVVVEDRSMDDLPLISSRFLEQSIPPPSSSFRFRARPTRGFMAR